MPRTVNQHTEQDLVRTYPDLAESGVLPPALDVVQDHPAVLDWRLLVVFVAAGVAALYFL